MPTIEKVIQRLLPRGSDGARNWERCPMWPPDLFALSATLVKLSACYTSDPTSLFKGKYVSEVKTLGDQWRRKGELPPRVQHVWDMLYRNRSRDLSEMETGWCSLALKLMTIADEASKGMGFLEPPGKLPLSDFVYWATTLLWNKKQILPYLPSSLCMMVPEEEVCVQPKTLTPQVGCTLQSLSHNLALLPSVKEITTNWLLSTADMQRKEKPLNLMLIPFPYQIDGQCFQAGQRYRLSDLDKSEFGNFRIRQDWLFKGTKNKRSRLTSKNLSQFITDLIKRAEDEVGSVHGVVLPELALDEVLTGKLVHILSKQTKLEFFISGIWSEKKRENKAYSALFSGGHVLSYWSQAKHHRWKLDGGQVRRYSLGDALDPEVFWWEDINVSNRECFFYVFRPGSTMATLVCEDLARIEPVQTALRSIGPNLVVVLLMDGAQELDRWSARYATVLADDPGSAVLTLTSLGMVRRSWVPGDKESQQIALWKDSGSPGRTLCLPKGSHALLLTLSTTCEENFTIDHRSDNKNSVKLSLSGVRDIVHPAPPDWLD